MKAVKIAGERKTDLIDLPDPNAKDNWVVVKILVAPMCTEYKMFKGGNVAQSIGHEAAGEVVEVAQPCKVKVGDRVVVMPQTPCGKCSLCGKGDYIHCRNNIPAAEATGYEHGCGTYAQYIVKPDWLLVPIPDDISYEHASMACCGLGPTFNAMQAMQVDALDTVLVTGLGPVGLGGVVNGWSRGARVIAVDGQPYRADLAKALSAEAVVDPEAADARDQIMALTNGVGTDKGIDCSGVPAAQRLQVDATRRKGQVSFVGEGGDVAIHVSNDMIRKGLTLRGIWHWNLGDTPRMMQVIRKCADLLDKHITHIFPMSRVQEAFELQLTGECGKVLLHPWE